VRENIRQQCIDFYTIRNIKENLLFFNLSSLAKISKRCSDVLRGDVAYNYKRLASNQTSDINMRGLSNACDRASENFRYVRFKKSEILRDEVIEIAREAKRIVDGV